MRESRWRGLRSSGEASDVCKATHTDTTTTRYNLLWIPGWFFWQNLVKKLWFTIFVTSVFQACNTIVQLHAHTMMYYSTHVFYDVISSTHVLDRLQVHEYSTVFKNTCTLHIEIHMYSTYWSKRVLKILKYTCTQHTEVRVLNIASTCVLNLLKYTCTHSIEVHVPSTDREWLVDGTARYMVYLSNTKIICWLLAAGSMEVKQGRDVRDYNERFMG